MNRKRRKEIKNVMSNLDGVQCTLKEMTDGDENDHGLTSVISDIASDIETIRDDETDYMYNIPENLQSSDRYYAAEEAVDNLDSAVECIFDAIDHCEECEYESASYDIDDVIIYLGDAAR